jgi:hypothetical protein
MIGIKGWAIINIFLSLPLIPSLTKKVIDMLNTLTIALTSSASKESFAIAHLVLGLMFLLLLSALILLLGVTIVQFFQLRRFKKDQAVSKKNIFFCAMHSAILILFFAFFYKTGILFTFSG